MVNSNLKVIFFLNFKPNGKFKPKYHIFLTLNPMVRRPTCFFHLEMLKDIMLACIILHNMIVEDERHTYLGANDFDYDQTDDSGPEPCHIIPLVTLCNSLNVIIPLEIEEFILNFKWITSSIYGNYKASHSNLEF